MLYWSFFDSLFFDYCFRLFILSWLLSFLNEALFILLFHLFQELLFVVNRLESTRTYRRFLPRDNVVLLNFFFREGSMTLKGPVLGFLRERLRLFLGSTLDVSEV